MLLLLCFPFRETIFTKKLKTLYISIKGVNFASTVGYCAAFRFITLLSSLNSDKLENFFKKKEEKHRKQECISY